MSGFNAVDVFHHAAETQSDLHGSALYVHLVAIYCNPVPSLTSLSCLFITVHEFFTSVFVFFPALMA